PDDLQSPLPRFGASSGNVPATQLTAPGWIQDSTTGRPISARAGISGGRSIPRGFVPAQAKVEVYSYSLSRWLPGIVVGLCVETGGIPPGSVCVMYEVSPKKYTQKILPPDNFSSGLRMAG
ncbi:Uncharacterized protein SCF082_LOCUS26635, partial [Durusdinium trenchii]